MKEIVRQSIDSSTNPIRYRGNLNAATRGSWNKAEPFHIIRDSIFFALRGAGMPAVESSASTDINQLSGERILVLDFGAQYAQLIARRVRENNVYCEIVRHDIPAENVKAHGATGLILSGGPSSVYADNAPKCDPAIFELGLPILGICYGMQLVCDSLGGKVDSSSKREFGGRQCFFSGDDPFLKDVPDEATVWMSHEDQVSTLR